MSWHTGERKGEENEGEWVRLVDETESRDDYRAERLRAEEEEREEE